MATVIGQNKTMIFSFRSDKPHQQWRQLAPLALHPTLLSCAWLPPLPACVSATVLSRPFAHIHHLARYFTKILKDTHVQSSVHILKGWRTHCSPKAAKIKSTWSPQLAIWLSNTHLRDHFFGNQFAWWTVGHTSLEIPTYTFLLISALYLHVSF